MSKQAIITLKYWTPGPFAQAFREVVGNDVDLVISAAYNGAAECLSGGYLRIAGRYGETYRITAKGMAKIDSLREQRASL